MGPIEVGGPLGCDTKPCRNFNYSIYQYTVVRSQKKAPSWKNARKDEGADRLANLGSLTRIRSADSSRWTVSTIQAGRSVMRSAPNTRSPYSHLIRTRSSRASHLALSSLICLLSCSLPSSRSPCPKFCLFSLIVSRQDHVAPTRPGRTVTSPTYHRDFGSATF